MSCSSSCLSSLLRCKALRCLLRTHHAAITTVIVTATHTITIVVVETEELPDVETGLADDAGAATVGATVRGAGPGVTVRTGLKPDDIGGAVDADTGNAGAREVRTGDGDAAGAAGEKEGGPGAGVRMLSGTVDVGIGDSGSTLDCAPLEGSPGLGEAVAEVASAVSSITAAKSSTPAFSSVQSPPVQPAKTTDPSGPAATASA